MSSPAPPPVVPGHGSGRRPRRRRTPQSRGVLKWGLVGCAGLSVIAIVGMVLFLRKAPQLMETLLGATEAPGRRGDRARRPGGGQGDVPEGVRRLRRDGEGREGEARGDPDAPEEDRRGAEGRPRHRARSSAASPSQLRGRCRSREPVRGRLRPDAAGRPARGDRGARPRLPRGEGAPGPPRRHRVGEDVHDGEGRRGARPARRSSSRTTRRSPRSSTRSSSASSRGTGSSTSSPTTTTTSPRRTSRSRTRTSRRKPRSTRRSTSSGSPRRPRSSSGATSSSSPRSRASTASGAPSRSGRWRSS